MSTELKDCPFCGSSDVSHGEVTTTLGARLVTQSECQQCGALGPYVDIRNVGIGEEGKLSKDAWSRRPALAASGGNAAPDGAVTDYGTMPELPEPVYVPVDVPYDNEVKAYTAEMMTAYGKACAAASAPNAALVAAAQSVVIAFNDKHTSLAQVARWVNELKEALSAAGQGVEK